LLLRGSEERQVKSQKAKGKNQKCIDPLSLHTDDVGSNDKASSRRDSCSDAFLPFAFCLLPFDLTRL
jgi:hypothetical protein